MLKEVGISYHAAEVHQRAFDNSHTVVFVFCEEQLIGFWKSSFGWRIPSGDIRCGCSSELSEKWNRQGNCASNCKQTAKLQLQFHFIRIAWQGEFL